MPIGRCDCCTAPWGLKHDCSRMLDSQLQRPETRAPWFTKGLRSMKRGWQLEQHWRKSKEDETHVWVHNQAHAVAVMELKKGFFLHHHCISRVRTMQLFRVVLSLLHLDTTGELRHLSRSRYDHFTVYFAEKNQSLLDWPWLQISNAQSLDIMSTLPSSILWDEFQLISPDDVNRIVGVACGLPLVLLINNFMIRPIMQI